MKKDSIYDKVNKFRMLMLTVVMLVGFSAVVWGQTSTLPNIPELDIKAEITRNTTIDNFNTVHKREQVIYVVPGKPRTLAIPEIMYNRSTTYNWYMHWYKGDNGDNFTLDKVGINLDLTYANQKSGISTVKTLVYAEQTYDGSKMFTSPSLLRTTSDGGFFWSRGLKKNVTEYASDASTVSVTIDDSFTGEAVLYCDVSDNNNYKCTFSTDSLTCKYEEPTLLKRYVYIIKSAKEYVDELDGGNGRAIYEIDYPKENGKINISMPSMPTNYFWDTDYKQGAYFAYAMDDENGTYTKFMTGKKLDAYLKGWQATQVNPEGKKATFYIKAIDENGNFSPVLAEFRFTPVENSGFMFEKDLDLDRRPWDNTRVYEEIGSYDFDLNDVVTELTKENNVSGTQMPQDETAYGFMQKTINSIENTNNVRNQYGLFRSANDSDISKNGTYFDKRSYKWWVIANASNSEYYKNTPLYDRTYESTKNTSEPKYGYFYYIDATDEPGRIVDVKINGTLCDYTELMVSVWIADLTRPMTNPLPPNINLILKGKRVKDDESTEDVVLHRFTSGDALTEYVNDEDLTGSTSDFNINLLRWQQLCYRVNLTKYDLNEFTQFNLEIENNEPHTDGADYAIDDVRIYKSKPDIRVLREDACDLSTLTVSSDYGTLLRNMGYMENEQTINDWSTINSSLLIYRLGLNGAPNYGDGSENFLTKSTFESYIFNSYYSFVEGLDDSRPNVEGVSVTKADDESLAKDYPDPIILGPTDLETGVNEGKDVYRWVRINKELKEYNPMVVFSYRTIITTRAPGFNAGGAYYNYATTAEEAQKWEYVFNLRALQDYNFLVDNWDKVSSNFTAISTKPSWLGQKLPIPASLENSGYVTFADADLALIANLPSMTEAQKSDYETVMHQFWAQFEIPRIRVPWYDKENNIMYLHKMDVSNTDLKYEGEVVGYDDQSIPIIATGNYHVVLQNAQAVGGGTVNVKDICTLISPFKIYTPVKISVDATASANVYACAGTLRKISADLVSKDFDNPLDETVYSFDWYLGSIDSYNSVKEDGYYLRDMLERLRTDYSSVFGADFGYDEVNAWQPTEGIDIKIKDVLLGLLNPENPMLVIDKKEFQLRISSTSIVAMPFTTGTSTDASGIETEYCMEITEVPIPAYSTDVPLLHPGFTPTNITYPFVGEVPLRLGYPVMDDAVQLVVPLQDGFGDSMADEAESLGLADQVNGASIVLSSVEDDYPVIGTAVSMLMKKGDENATVTIKFDSEKVKSLLHEGRRYDLLIPFVQFDGNNNQLLSACDGILSLPIKIVPEYLTWKGNAGDKWYDEGKWYQSTKEELYFDGWDGTEAGNDANGSDNIAEAYSPLYFTKITIPEGGELTMNTVGNDADDSRFIAGWATDSSDSIRFEMAVNKGSDGNLEIVPYYINKVDQIYFKPEAKLKSQHLLDYQKAWVEFEMEKGKTYWLASPLKDVFAGDMYAPTVTGRQTTPAFADITYTDKTADGNYDRWNPAFYQKAWDKGITYYTNTAGTVSETVSAVQSNWSIEYNDVNVPYTLGKGFYASVEGDFTGDSNNGIALVRLPKADKSYLYYTRAADVSSIAERTYAGKLADGSDINITLSDDDTEAVNPNPDGDGTHFLLGNPYMYPLDMTKFFDGNSNIFNRKYWILSDGTTSAAVGTPDIGFGDGTGATITPGQIPPMTAFFVELAAPLNETTKSVEIKFTKDMMADAVTPNSVKTRSYSASRPVITLTADRGDVRSVAKLMISDKADNGYVASEDAVVLLDSELDAPMAYTVAGSMAAQVNVLKSVKNVPLGVYAADGDAVELTLSGISQFAEKLYLYDAMTKHSTPLDEDSYTIHLTGPSHGRYMLTSEASVPMVGDISVYSPSARQIVVMSPPESPLRRVRVYDVAGQLEASGDNIGNSTFKLSVPSGIHVVSAENETGKVTVKVRVR